jgi:hypothetical protein
MNIKFDDDQSPPIVEYFIFNIVSSWKFHKL